MHILRALFLYDSDNTGVVCVLCSYEGDNMHTVHAVMEEFTLLYSCLMRCLGVMYKPGTLMKIKGNILSCV